MAHDTNEDLAEAFWVSLAKSRTVMLGAVGDTAEAARPMTAQVDEDIKDGSIYFFASRDEGIGREVLNGVTKASFAFQSKDSEVLASAIGPITVTIDQAMIDKLWSVFASLYYYDGKYDPNLVLLRFAPPEIEIWKNSTTNFLKAIAFKVVGKDAGQAFNDARATITP